MPHRAWKILKIAIDQWFTHRSARGTFQLVVRSLFAIPFAINLSRLSVELGDTHPSSITTLRHIVVACERPRGRLISK